MFQRIISNLVVFYVFFLFDELKLRELWTIFVTPPFVIGPFKTVKLLDEKACNFDKIVFLSGVLTCTYARVDVG